MVFNSRYQLNAVKEANRDSRLDNYTLGGLRSRYKMDLQVPMNAFSL